MTDKQLAILLRGYQLQLVAIAEFMEGEEAILEGVLHFRESLALDIQTLLKKGEDND